MKTLFIIATRCLLLLSLFFSVHAASGFYDPAAQRWINRDPLGEFGFEMFRRTSENNNSEQFELSDFVHEKVHLYRFIQNNPLNQFDPLGLVGSYPPGWPGPGKPYNPSERNNQFCGPAPECLLEGLAVTAAAEFVILMCNPTPLATGCGGAVFWYAVALDNYFSCLKKL